VGCRFHGYPGFLLGISSDGLITEANDVFERAVGGDACGTSLASYVDATSSHNKVARILANPRQASETTWELIVATNDTLDAHTFAVVLQDNGDGLLLIELPRDPRVDQLTDQLTRLNSDLASAQRELSRENRELDRVNKALDEFAHVVSHDLRAPLRAIGTFANWIERDVGPLLKDESKEHFDLLQNRVALLEKMISGILAAARAGRETVNKEDVDVGALVDEVVSLIDPHGSVSVTTRALPTLHTERAPLQQVLMNLIGNAVKHGGRADLKIEVAANRDDRNWTFSVRDNGAGIPNEMQSRVWQLFQTGKPREDIDASGIGLSVVKNIVERRGGRVWLESSESGTAFFFDWRDG
jgi:signal transduction histidine kinase